MVGDVDGYPPILDRERWERIRAVLTDPERARFTQKGGKSWISGLIRCARCGGAMYAQSGLDLKCAGTPPDGGEPCRKTTIRREFVETDCESRIVARLSDKRVRRALAKLDRDTLAAMVADAEHRSRVLAAEYGAGTLSEAAFTAGARAARDTMTATAGRLR